MRCWSRLLEKRAYAAGMFLGKFRDERCVNGFGGIDPTVAKSLADRLNPHLSGQGENS